VFLRQAVAFYLLLLPPQPAGSKYYYDDAFLHLAAGKY
jgi:hypothetical protein